MRLMGLDVGTTGMKIGIYDEMAGGELKLAAQFSKEYPINVYNDGLFGDIEQEKWKTAFREGCKELSEHVASVDAIGISGTTPGLSAMDADGNGLYPAILMLDQRSRVQAAHIIQTIGIETLLNETGNMPVAGGCSLASILWIKDNHPDIFSNTVCFGHSNTYMAKWLSGEFAIDPSSASLSALYNLVKNDYTWNEGIASEFGISGDRLPNLIPAYESAGNMLPDVAKELGFTKEPPIIIGGNDAVLAAYSVGISNPGQVINVNGTCEITLVCLPKCLSSRNYNVRAHVLPGRWLTLYVMNAGGKAYEWFKSVFCNDLTVDEYHNDFIPGAIDQWLSRENTVTYIPYLMGSRYSLEPLKGEFIGLTQETTREQIMAAMVRGLCSYQREHLKDIGLEVPLKPDIHITGGATSPAIVRAKKKWMRDCDYIPEEQSSMKGAAMCAGKYLV